MKENSIERLESIKEAHKSVKNDYSGIGGLIMSELVGGGSK